jgi:O-antigen/teichoic acid export membrane protein
MKAILQVLSFDVASKTLLAILGILLIRFMPPTEYALYTFALSVSAVASQTLTSSFNRIYIVAYKNLRLDKAQTSFLGLQLLGTAAFIVLGIPLSKSLGVAYWVVAMLIVATCFSEFSKTFFQQGLEFFRFSLVELFRSIAMFLGILMLIFVVRYELRAWQALLIQAIAMLMVFGPFVGKHVTLMELLKVPKALRMAKVIVNDSYRYLFGYFLLLAFFSQIDIFMLKATANDLQLATYGSGFRYYIILLLTLSAVHTVLLPLVQGAQNCEELDAIFDRHKKMIFVFSLVVLLGGWTAQWFIPWVDGGKYHDAIIVFRILCISAVISFAFSPHVNILMRFERFRFLFGLICIALILSVLLNLTLIPRWGAIGTSVATLISSAAVTFPIYFQSRKLSQQLLAANGASQF